MVQLDLDDAAEPRLEFASELARQFEADLIAFAAAEARMSFQWAIAASWLPMPCDGRSRKSKSGSSALEREFQSMTADNPRASWRGYVGDPTRLLASHARAADLIIVGSPAPAVIERPQPHCRPRSPDPLRGSADPVGIRRPGPCQARERCHCVEGYPRSAPCCSRRHAVPDQGASMSLVRHRRR